MSTLHVLMPPFSGAADASALRHWLAHGDRMPGLANARVAVLRECFRVPGAALPVAALRHHCHAGDAENGAWLCADPAWVRSEATGARLMACPVDDVSATEAAQLAALLRPLFGDAGVALAVDTPAAWCVHLERGAPPVTLTHPVDALGASLIECLPAGEAGSKWRHLFNEAQVALHAHPVNAARIAAGKRPINALWFWGEGPLPDSVETRLRYVASADDVLRGLAKVAGAASVEPSPEVLADRRGGGDVLLDLDAPGSVGGLAAWLASFRRCLRERRFDAVVLAFSSGERFRVRHAHRLRFWRRA
ncbi:MAG TPA: phosphoglycerate mutase [Rhodanobacteraceae bacterium]|nr:phosphoglycerate mutase [Rhodanobacteraceae bacterium]